MPGRTALARRLRAGGSEGPWKIADHSSSGLGLFAAAPVTVGEVVMSIPARMQLSKRTCPFTSTMMKAASVGLSSVQSRSDSDAAVHESIGMLALILLTERTHGDKSPFVDYIDALPPLDTLGRHPKNQSQTRYQGPSRDDSPPFVFRFCRLALAARGLADVAQHRGRGCGCVGQSGGGRAHSAISSPRDIDAHAIFQLGAVPMGASLCPLSGVSDGRRRG